MLVKDRVDCRFLHESSKLKRDRTYQTVKTQTLFHNCPFCLVVSMLASKHWGRTSKHIHR